MKKYLVLFTAVIVLSTGAFFTQQWFVDFSSPRAETSSLRSTSFTFTANATGTVLEAMRALEKDASFTFSGREFSGLGFFVEEINGKRGENGYYWILHINGTTSDLGVSQARVGPGDSVEWRYEKGY